MMPGDLFWAELPQTNGREQAGRRPCIIFQDDNFAARLPVALVIPLTTAPGAKRFPATLEIHASKDNGLPSDSFALAFQLRAIDRRRIIGQIGSLEPPQLIRLYELVDRLTGRQKTGN